MTPGAVRVIGLGNVLMGDDGFGPYVIHELQAGYEFPDEVTLIDVGTPGLDLTPYLMHAKKLVVVDIVRSDGPSGTIRLYRKEDILRHAPQPRLGPHDPGLKETLLALDLDGSGPDEVLLVGAIAERTEASTRLTPALRGAVNEAVIEVLLELTRLGVKIRALEDVAAIAPWWESPLRSEPRGGQPTRAGIPAPRP